MLQIHYWFDNWIFLNNWQCNVERHHRSRFPAKSKIAVGHLSTTTTTCQGKARRWFLWRRGEWKNLKKRMNSKNSWNRIWAKSKSRIATYWPNYKEKRKRFNNWRPKLNCKKRKLRSTSKKRKIGRHGRKNMKWLLKAEERKITLKLMKSQKNIKKLSRIHKL